MHERDDPLWHFVHNRLPGPPSARFLGWRCVELDVARGTIAVEFTPPPDCLNPARGIAGGFIAQMLDATIGPGVAITLEPGQFPTTVEFKVCFLRPIRLGKVIGRARIVHRGEAMVFAEGRIGISNGIFSPTWAIITPGVRQLRCIIRYAKWKISILLAGIFLNKKARAYARTFGKYTALVVMASIIYNQLPVYLAPLKTSNTSVIPSIAQPFPVANADSAVVDAQLAALWQKKIRKMQDEIIDDLGNKCETLNWQRGGWDSQDAVITYDPDKTGRQSRVPSFGWLQEKIGTVQLYAPKVFGRTVNQLEAQQIAQNREQAREIARHMIFVEKVGHTTLGWFNCFNNRPELDLKDRVDDVLRLETFEGV